MLKHMPPGPPGGHQLHHQSQIPQPQQRPVVSSVTAGPASINNNSTTNVNNTSRSSLLIRSPNHHQHHHQQQHQSQQPLNVLTLTSPVSSTSIKPIANGGPRLTNLLLTNTTAPTTPTNTTNTNIYSQSQSHHHPQPQLHNPSQHLTHQSFSNNHHNNHNYSNCNNLNSTALPNIKHRIGAREATTSLGLLCLVSLLLALLSLIFLLKISPSGREPPPPPPGPLSDDYIIVYDVTLALCALSLSLNLCCLLVCAVQFLFAVKLVRAPATTGRGNKYLQKSSVSRVCAVGGFFISIPIFLTGIILYTFTQFHSTPAIITSILIGVGIIFCGAAMVHNVFIWQKEKTICVRNQPLNYSIQSQISAITPPSQFLNHTATGTAHQMTNGHLPSGIGPPPTTQPSSTSPHHNKTQLNLSHPTPIIPSLTPLSPNHSHVSFNHSFMRTATATPPTPKVLGNGVSSAARETSGSTSPGANGTHDLSAATNLSLHELSTLV